MSKGRVTIWWRESDAFRRHASRVRRRFLRAYWRENGLRGRLPTAPDATARTEYEAEQLLERRAERREADREIRPLLERLGFARGRSHAR